MENMSDLEKTLHEATHTHENPHPHEHHEEKTKTHQQHENHPGKHRFSAEVSEFVKQTVKNFHISAAYDCLETTQTDLDFAGICVLNLLGSDAVLEDNEHKVQSGYIFNTRVINIDEIKNRKRAIRQVYDRVFEKIRKHNGVYILGFEQKEKHMKVVRHPFDQKKIRKNFPKRLVQSSTPIFQALTFGAILTYKLSGQHNVSPHDAALAYCLYNLIHQHGSSANKSRFPVVKMKVPKHKKRFLRHVFENLGVSHEVLHLAFTKELNDEKWFSNAIKTILDGMKGEHENEEDHTKLVEGVAKVFNSDFGGASDFVLSQEELE